MPCSRCLGGWYPSMPCRSWGCIPACLAGFQAQNPRGSLRGLARGVARPTLWGSPGPHLGVSPGPHPGGVSRPTPGGVSRPTPGGVSRLTWGWGGVCIPACTEADTPPADGYCWNAFLFGQFVPKNCMKFK